jgi:PGF-pre-PGF domain-containing protein
VNQTWVNSTATSTIVPNIPEPQSNIAANDTSYAFASAGIYTNVSFQTNNTSVLNLSFIANNNVGAIIVVIDLLNGQSSLTTGSPSGNVYQFLDIWVQNSSAANVDNIANATVGFKVAKSWIQSNNIDQSSIKLNRYSNGVWNPLSAVLVGDDGTYMYFIAQTPGFSPFAITGNTILVPTAPLSITKAANPMTYKSVGQKITYTYIVTNSGTAPISGITVTDNKVSVKISSSTLAPGSSVKGTAIYTITQADINAGSLTSSVAAKGTYNGKTVTSNTVTTIVTAIQIPAIKLVKTANLQTYSSVGQKITYTYTVTNSGNVPISDIKVTDGKITVKISSSILSPGSSAKGTGIYTITKADIKAGSVTNSASAMGTFNKKTVASNQVTVTVKVTPPWAFFSGMPTNGKAPLTVHFTDRSKYNPTEWKWSFGDGSTSTNQNTLHVYTNPGKYTVTLVAKNSGGSDSDTIKNYITVGKK